MIEEDRRYTIRLLKSQILSLYIEVIQAGKVCRCTFCFEGACLSVLAVGL